MEDERLINPELEGPGEERMENSLRPKTLDEYIALQDLEKLLYQILSQMR